MTRGQNLTDIIPETLHSHIPRRFEVFGDIAVVSFPDELTSYKLQIARSIIADRHNITTVLRRVSKRSSYHRVAHYEPIIGTKTCTTCRESGFVYRIDLLNAFFTTRLVGERQRISSQIQPGELVLIPFAGVGPFVIPAAARGAQVIAIEKNPYACVLLQENVRLNHCTDRVLVIQGDAITTHTLLKTRTDRVIIPTPYGMDETFPLLSGMVKPGGVIHYYTFHNKSGAEELSRDFHDSGFKVDRLHRCGNVAPSVSRWVFDVRVGTDIL
ncbi:MAG: RsmD family RNA methyltransferase [Methanospirillum sp.]|uniref:class I SAM-dependent methyltransferase n=1 Tax=Methanospirillum sp. TaxID=45200 RepID=UPI00236BC209|nr:RsmD family RNA methyltransferase [Methanospirillum sp.]MDD1729806.1 RsmD family RNA methyltransferase [Methanospirillum sp.]